MIVEGTHPPITIDLDSNEPGMTLQRRDGRYLVWRDYQMDGETVKSPVDIDALPPGIKTPPKRGLSLTLSFDLPPGFAESFFKIFKGFRVFFNSAMFIY
jgi:hypothetical protein